jgi:hypothetical protein
VAEINHTLEAGLGIPGKGGTMRKDEGTEKGTEKRKRFSSIISGNYKIHDNVYICS